MLNKICQITYPITSLPQLNKPQDKASDAFLFFHLG
jgi:hypothetical protein